MKAMMKYGIPAVFVACLFGAAAGASDGTELVAAYRDMYWPALDTATTLDVSQLELEHKDLRIRFNFGRLAFFKPVRIDSDDVVFGAFFDGEGSFQYAPPVNIEKEQLRRFMESDSLNRSFEKMYLLFSPEFYEQIVSHGKAATELFTSGQDGSVEDLHEMVVSTFVFRALRGVTHPSQRPFLFVSTALDKGGRVFYMFDPHEREEVNFLKRFWEPGTDFMETVCQYSQYIDPTYVNINGLCKECVEVYRYNIEASISSGADFNAVADVSLEVKVGPTQLLPMELHRELTVDSIVDSAGQRVEFVRYEEKDLPEPLYLFFDRPLTAGEITTLRFYYGGDVVKREMGEFFVQAKAHWYPRYGFRQRALFNLKFKTHKDFAFVASGNLTAEEISGDTLITTWKVVPPVPNASFTIGNLKKYTFEEKDVAPIDVYFSEKLHDEYGRILAEEAILTGKDMEKQVAADIINAIRLFSHHFGPYPYERMSVSEILTSHGEAFPGFLHLGFDTWQRTDTWGYQRSFRAHEVAHQWWGVGVDRETYHDQWLTEGFATYSALLYLQAVAGNDQFLDRLKEYRNDIYSVRQYLFSSGEEAGPVALGYRTSSTKSRGDFGLVIYKKGAWILHMLRNMLIDLRTMNEDVFFTMLKEWYGTKRGANVRTSDFKRLVEKYAGMDMTWFFDQWVYSSALPECEFTYNIDVDGKGGYIARCRIVTTGVPEDFAMIYPLEIEITEDSKAYVRITVESLDYEFTLPDLPSKPRKLRLNPFESVLAKIKQ
ncbi:MAG: hypothetical protein JSW34_06800 [Candidatus Zixiibacteriota bacterium]|nr:MAG: hypothetical protein JSW34_06800 [candidate division Zixibacteria bacterium]